jgi:hypothetical protein
MALISTVPEKRTSANKLTSQTPPAEKQPAAHALQTNSLLSFPGPKDAIFTANEPTSHSTSSRTTKQLTQPSNQSDFQERVKGIEPSQPAWKAGALPLSYTRK